MWDIVLEEKNWQIILAIIFVVMVPFFICQAYKDAERYRRYKYRILHGTEEKDWQSIFAKYIGKI